MATKKKSKRGPGRPRKYPSTKERESLAAQEELARTAVFNGWLTLPTPEQLQ